MNFRVWFSACTICLVLPIVGCTLLPLKKLQPTLAPPSGDTCTVPVSLMRGAAPAFGYLLPYDPSVHAADLLVEPAGTNSDQLLLASAPSFEKYDNAIASRVQSKMGDELAKDPVVVAFRKTRESVSAEVQLDAQIADGTTSKYSIDVQAQVESIQKNRPPAKLTHGQLKSFSNKLFTLQLKHGAADLTTSSPNQRVMDAASKTRSPLTRYNATKPTFDQGLVAYLKAYYEGKFYDRFGTAISKPQLPDTSNLVSSLSNFSVPDSEIVAAETVLLEFLIDTIDVTPVMGDTKCPIPSITATASCKPDPQDPAKTTYYPGKSANQPTALTVGYARYLQLQPKGGCGITTDNAWVLQTLANGASGDNATLSDLVKTAASEVALRATLLSAYFSLYRVKFTPIVAP
jgi:hypothetical protein